MKIAGILLSVILEISLLMYWFFYVSGPLFSQRIPIPENSPQTNRPKPENNPNPGTFIKGTAKASLDKGTWPGFRGLKRDNVVEDIPIATKWPKSGPKVLWSTTVGHGHAGVAVYKGRLYMIDYDEDKKEDAIRCMSLDNGEDIWRYTYYVKIQPNHGMSRTIPAVNDEYVVALGPMCHLHCLDSNTGRVVWKKNLISEYGTVLPEWYAGQCPLIDGERVILAPGGKCMLTAIELSTGNTIWETPNPDSWQMTHSSVLAYDFEGETQYIWCGSGGVAGIDAKTGDCLWKDTQWKVKFATVPTPVDAGEGRILLTGGYDSGAMMIQIMREGGRIIAKKLFRTEPSQFGSDQQTPIFYKGLIYGVIPGGKLSCMSVDGKILWTLQGYNFGLGPYIMVNRKLIILDDIPPLLYLFDVGPSGARELAKAKLLPGKDAWAPLAYVNGKLIIRDSKTLMCVDLR